MSSIFNEKIYKKTDYLYLRAVIVKLFLNKTFSQKEVKGRDHVV